MEFKQWHLLQNAKCAERISISGIRYLRGKMNAIDNREYFFGGVFWRVDFE